MVVPPDQHAGMMDVVKENSCSVYDVPRSRHASSATPLKAFNWLRFSWTRKRGSANQSTTDIALSFFQSILGFFFFLVWSDGPVLTRILLRIHLNKIRPLLPDLLRLFPILDRSFYRMTQQYKDANMSVMIPNP